MNSDVLSGSIETIGSAAIGASFLAGLLFSINPVAIAAIPLAMAYVTKARSQWDSVLYGSMFVAGLILTHAALGFLSGMGGEWIKSLFGRGWAVVLGPFLIVLGAVWAGWIPLKLPPIALRASRPASAWGAFALAVPFSVAICPFCTPALLVLIGAAAALGSPWWGMILLAAFAIGRAVPIAAGAGTLGWIENQPRFAVLRKTFEFTGGAVMVATGLYLLNSYFYWIPALSS